MRRLRPDIDPLAHLPLFAACSRRERARLLRRVERVHVPAGTPIAREGTYARAVYVVASGHVTFSKDGRLIGEAGPGEHFGETSALDGQPFAATATAGTDAELVEIGRRELLAAIETVPVVAQRLLADLATGVRPHDLAA